MSLTQIKCLKCGDVIDSKHRHDFVWCKCQNVFIDGGDDYTRYGGDFYKDDSAVFILNGKQQSIVTGKEVSQLQ